MKDSTFDLFVHTPFYYFFRRTKFVSIPLQGILKKYNCDMVHFNNIKKTIVYRDSCHTKTNLFLWFWIKHKIWQRILRLLFYDWSWIDFRIFDTNVTVFRKEFVLLFGFFSEWIVFKQFFFPPNNNSNIQFVDLFIWRYI